MAAETAASGRSSASGAPTGGPASDRCPRCGAAFHCGMADPGPCACTGVALDAATLARLRQAYVGCLCVRCLRELAAGGPGAAAPPPAP